MVSFARSPPLNPSPRLFNLIGFQPSEDVPARTRQEDDRTQAIDFPRAIG
ncbi:hypothetical protein [Tychonema sp. LEGE 06208]|nr:hypothetical protein [Tychonema sp. LEGE 06208]MBE9164831.1 hypothetical protein [Tychonema sp. LEGE 06208]